jgi:alginate O-acetyltransferase complex protein AlgI
LTGAVAYLGAMIGLSAALPTPYTVAWYLTPELWLALVAGAIGSMPVVPALAERLDRARSEASRPRLAFGLADAAGTAALAALLVASVMQMAARTYNPFIYFRF